MLFDFEGAAEVVDYWHALELLEPQKIPKIRADPATNVYEVGKRGKLPWEAGHRHLNKPLKSANQRWLYEVYLGIFPLQDARELWRRELKIDARVGERRISGHGAIAGFLVDHEGQIVEESEVLSSSAWLSGALVRQGSGALNNLREFNAASARFSDAFNKMFEDDPTQEFKKEWVQKILVDVSELVAPGAGEALELAKAIVELAEKPERLSDVYLDLASGAAKWMTLKELIKGPVVRVKATVVHENTKLEERQLDFVNSFITSDLAKVSTNIRKKAVGKGLRRYLTAASSTDVTERVDVELSSDEILTRLQPNDFPKGRWPSKVQHSLYPRQQLAVNHVFKELQTGSGIAGVNGPPGTGKTTMLREIIANVVVERATVLSQLQSPENAFQTKQGDGENDWSSKMAGFEIVVASSNNKAVENITLDIPRSSEVTTEGSLAEQMADLDYFTEVATSLLQKDKRDDQAADESKVDDQPSETAWALTAARLGKRSNRASFKETFYWSASNPIGMKHFLGNAQPWPVSKWDEAKKRFEAAVRVVEDLRKERQNAHDEFVARRAMLASIAPLEAELVQLDESERDTSKEVEKARLEFESLNVTIARLRYERGELSAWRPLQWVAIFHMGRKLRRLTDKQMRVESLGKALSREQRAMREHRSSVINEIGRRHKECHRLREQLDSSDLAVPSDHWFNSDKAHRESRETHAVWSDPAWNEARSRVFLEAMNLHKTFVHCVPGVMKEHLGIVADAFGGKGMEKAKLLEAWRWLFVVVPVVSTTFASFDRLFPAHGKESIGWLLIDEAGQAAPQNAVGAIWRARRTVVVGDPAQLEPVVVLPEEPRLDLADSRGVSREWASSRLSAQLLADRQTAVGTLPLDGSADWVGVPLVVHHRCDNPMFDICNEIAYDGRMVSAVKGRDSFAFETSRWIDVRSGASEGNWIPEEGAETIRLLDQLHAAGVPNKDVMLLSPFVDGANGIHRLTRGRQEFKAVGTVHTAQGGEADVVILVLGGDPSKSEGKEFASEKPNLLNVAVSRAKRRLFVIGNQKEWCESGYFKTMRRELIENQAKIC